MDALTAAEAGVGGTRGTPLPPGRQVVGLAGWILLSFLAATSGFLGAPGEWYRGLEKPSWNPPSWVFGPAWSMLYTLMGTAAWLVWRRGGWRQQAVPLGWWLAQWVLNFAWTPLFFGLHRMDLAFAEIVVFAGVLAVTLGRFWKVSRTAGLLMVPYLGWVCFASLLNFTLWRLNAR